jgi:flavodoxin
MRILVTYGSTRGGTQGLAEMVAGDWRDDERVKCLIGA